MPTRDRLLEQLQHVLQDLHARVEEVDALRDLEVAPRRVVQRLQVGVCPEDLLRVIVSGEWLADGFAALRWDGTGRTGESRTEPTELMLVRRRNSSPIFRMISLWFMSILPVSLMISGMSFVSSMVVEMRFSNWGSREYVWVCLTRSTWWDATYQRDLHGLGERM